jgi:hypothetical protein
MAVVPGNMQQPRGGYPAIFVVVSFTVTILHETADPF